jgi:hypothetical protein
MTTLQELMKAVETVADGTTLGVIDKEIVIEMVEKSYLAGQNSMPQPGDVVRLGKELETDAYKKGREDEKKRVVEMIERMKLPDVKLDLVNDPRDIIFRQGQTDGYNIALSDLKQSIIK